LLTPAGRGAIASLRVEGPSAVEQVMRFFKPAVSLPDNAPPCGRIVFGNWHSSSDQVSEELVIHRDRFDAVEIHCHGGQQSANRILRCLETAGCTVVSGWELARSAITDRLAADAFEALAEARTPKTASILLDQFHGALKNELLHLIAEARRGEKKQVEARLKALHERSQWGLHLIRPWQVVLTGAPNVGKSTLLNAMLGFQRALVHDQPGTTRDVVAEITILDGWPVQLADTAGLREAIDPVEREGVERARRQIASADLVLLVLDRGQPAPAEYRSAIQQRPYLTVINKTDLLAADRNAASNTAQSSLRPTTSSPTTSSPTTSSPTTSSLAVSGLTGDGVPELITAILERLGVPQSEPGLAVPFLDHQAEAIRQAREAVQLDAWDRAADLLENLVLGLARGPAGGPAVGS
jgi:tRNA modification GTPase